MMAGSKQYTIDAYKLYKWIYANEQSDAVGIEAILEYIRTELSIDKYQFYMDEWGNDSRD